MNLVFKYSKITLYNRDELIEELGLNINISNENLILVLYRKNGISFLNKLNGDFAFVLYDNMEDKYILSRDAMGICVLYYTEYRGKYYFSDDLDEIFNRSGKRKVVNLKSVKSMVESCAVDYEDTMYKNIYRVPQAHYLTIKNNKKVLNRYWYPEKIEVDYKISLEDAVKQFQILFMEAIEVRVIDDNSTAYELSGGLDSSSIVSIYKNRYLDKNIDTYSMYFGDFKCDESSYIKSIEKKYLFKTNSINIKNLDYKNRYNFLFNYNLSPHWPILTTFTMYIPLFEQIKKDNKKIVITGQGGDHLLAGNCNILADLLKRFEFKKLYNELYIFKSGKIPYFLKCALWDNLSKKNKQFIKKIFFKDKKKIELDKYDLFSLDSVKYQSQKYNISLLVIPSQSTNLDGNIFHSLEKLYNIECRHPFYDKKLVEFLLSLPPEYKYSEGYTKVLLRYVMDKILPDKVRLREDKAEFSEVLREQLEAIDIKELFLDSKLIKADIINRNKIENLLDAFNRLDNEVVVELWTIVNVEFWYQYCTEK